MMMKVLIFLMISTVSSYSFCPKCVHFYITTHEEKKTKPNCNLFKDHPLFKERPDVDFIGKEICTEKGKYFKYLNNEDNTEPKEEDDNKYIVAS